jgi:hypothetical protein
MALTVLPARFSHCTTLWWPFPCPLLPPLPCLFFQNFVPISIDDTKDEFKDDTEGEKSGELLKRPPHGSEIFVGGITRDTTEEDLRNLCSCCGDIYEVGRFC